MPLHFLTELNRVGGVRVPPTVLLVCGGFVGSATRPPFAAFTTTGLRMLRAFCDIVYVEATPVQFVEEKNQVGGVSLARLRCRGLFVRPYSHPSSRSRLHVLSACFPHVLFLLCRSRDDGGGDFIAFAVAAVEAFVAPSTRAPWIWVCRKVGIIGTLLPISAIHRYLAPLLETGPRAIHTYPRPRQSPRYPRPP